MGHGGSPIKLHVPVTELQSRTASYEGWEEFPSIQQAEASKGSKSDLRSPFSNVRFTFLLCFLTVFGLTYLDKFFCGSPFRPLAHKVALLIVAWNRNIIIRCLPANSTGQDERWHLPRP